MISEEEIYNKKLLQMQKILKDISLNITVVNTTVICSFKNKMLYSVLSSHLYK